MKTSKADFIYFKARCEHWIEVLGINDWDVEYNHLEITADARYIGNCVNRGCTLILATEWEKREVTKAKLNKFALHEVIHLLLGEMSGIGQARYMTEDEFDTAEHAVVNRLIKVLI